MLAQPAAFAGRSETYHVTTSVCMGSVQSLQLVYLWLDPELFFTA